MHQINPVAALFQVFACDGIYNIITFVLCQLIVNVIHQEHLIVIQMHFAAGFKAVEPPFVNVNRQAFFCKNKIRFPVFAGYCPCIGAKYALLNVNAGMYGA